MDEKTKIEEKKEIKKIEAKPEVKPKETKILNAFVRGRDLPISTKHSIAICNAIRNKKLKDAEEILELAIKKKKPIAMKGEIPHRAGGKPGRYPVKAAGVFIKLLKELKANAAVKGLSDVFIVKAIANKASMPVRATRIGYGRKKFKRTHVELEAIEK